MKKDIHPENYRLVVFKDLSCDYSFLTKSTVKLVLTEKNLHGHYLCQFELFRAELLYKASTVLDVTKLRLSLLNSKVTTRNKAIKYDNFLA